MNILKINLAIPMLLMGTTITKAATFLCLPFLSIFLVQKFHISPILTGVIVGSGQISIILGGFIGGQLSDFFGRVNLLLISIFGTALTLCGFWVISTLNMFLVIVVAFSLMNLLNGFISSFFQPISQALMSDLSPPDIRFKIFQFRYAAINIGAAVGPFIGAALGISASSRSFFWSSILFCFYGLFMGVVLKFCPIQLNRITSKKVTLNDSFRILSKDRKLRYFIISGIIFLCVMFK
jgi:MFS family permease